jgi:hypothetical protein
MPTRSRTDLKALREMIAQAHLILTTTTLPQGRAERACELLDTATKLADHLLTISPAATLGQKGGLKTAKRGSEYFRQLSARRKNHAGGRPRKQSE